MSTDPITFDTEAAGTILADASELKTIEERLEALRKKYLPDVKRGKRGIKYPAIARIRAEMRKRSADLIVGAIPKEDNA